jgi:hypothetical protein
MAQTPPIGATGPDPRIHRCEMPGCGITAYFGHREIIGEQIIEHWRCSHHKPADWPKVAPS